MNQKYGEKAKLCWRGTYSFIIYIKTEDNNADIAKEVETRIDTSNYDLEGPLAKEKNEKVIGLMKDGLCGKMMKGFSTFIPKTYSYLTNNSNGNEKNIKAKGTKKYVIKRKLKFED